ncbi:DUF2911 domain-containing protein [Maribacter hydrothermalis]|uniref:Uncharacterized protein n=1 Tax=Maribacter hydrothermalis TaxID=1836467 RepID=A0A1B7Z7C1_9FLAO|nr:DUF2911 domain-containing protein [Maribacter hydrothermalis]APQ16378.1 hypothetical protein BTR34_03060 [Maribacter hydrothermalis]OBR38480.1 hypothetical protein A9200_17570 [Maribacter hydrothermalis]
MRYGWVLVLLLICSHIKAQINHPKASPFAKIEQELGLTKITIEYSRPAARGRTLFGNQPNGESALVPYGRIWRVGANESTKISFSSDVKIGGNTILKGTYALYAFPGENEWQIIFHKNVTHWGDGRTAYNSNEDALRIKVTPVKTLDFHENFLIFFDAIDHNEMVMIWQWGNTKIVIPIYVDTQKMMVSHINQKLKNSPSAQTYYEIARYYQEQGMHFVEALTYVNNSIELGGNTYYYHRVRSLILADLKEYEEAIKAAEISKELAIKEGKDEFVRLNDNKIRVWKIAELKNK